jgi:glutamyl/glutaminyl-tRNA synthetase
LGEAGRGYAPPVTLPSLPEVRVRFAPSPTGALHLGSALVALANAAVARAARGVLVLRIDDTDRARSSDEDTFELLRLLRWLGVDWDEGPIHQSERADEYRVALDRLLDEGDAYPCFCGDARLAQLREEQQRVGMPPRYDGRCRALAPVDVQRALADGAPHVLRFAVPDARDVSFDDLVDGRVVVPAGSFGDPVLCRADGSVGYLLASVVDDVALGITHVVRGEDHLPNTARQVLLFEALGATIPSFAHLPLLRDEDGRKLSKRAPLGTLDELADEGFLPRTVRRYLAELLGQGAVDLLGEDAASIDLARIPTGAPRVDRARLESLGREDMAARDVTELLLDMGIEASPERALIVAELAAASPSLVSLRGELRLVFDGPGGGDLPLVFGIVAPDAAAREALDSALDAVVPLLRAHAGSTSAAGWGGAVRTSLVAGAKQAGLGAGTVLRPLRIALTGMSGGPGIDLVLEAIGPAEALRRVQLARAVLAELRGGGNEAVVG